MQDQLATLCSILIPAKSGPVRMPCTAVTQPALVSEIQHKMFRSSPSYSPPGRGRSPSYSPPRARRFSPVRGSSSKGGVSPPRGNPLPVYRSPGRSRSRSPRRSRSRRSRSRSRRNRSMERRSRSRSPMSKTIPSNQYPWQDEETLTTLYCKACNVYLHDR